MLSKKITFLTTKLLLILSLLACSGLAAPTPVPSTGSEGQALEVVTYTEESTAVPIEPMATSATAADTPTVSLNAPAATPALLPTQEPTETEPPAVSPAISAEPAFLTTEPTARPRNEMNIRQGPGTDYPVIGSAVAGESFNITGRNEAVSWLQVSSDAISQGWLYADLVEISGDVLTAPVVQVDKIPDPRLKQRRSPLCQRLRNRREPFTLPFPSHPKVSVILTRPPASQAVSILMGFRLAGFTKLALMGRI